MKTAISLPDYLYEEAEKTALYLGIPRSQLFARALEEFISNHQQEHITEKLNEVYDGMQDTAAIDASLESIREFTKDDAW